MIIILGIILIYLNIILNPKINIRKIIILIILLNIFNIIYIDNISIFDSIITLTYLNNFNINIILILFIIYLLFNKHIFLSNIKYLIILTNLIGILLLISSTDLIFIFINIELINLTLYLLIGNFSSGIKYFLLSSLITTFILLSFTLIYSCYGILNIEYILCIFNYKSCSLGFLLLFLSLFFKLGLFPFHSWSPDLYRGISYILMIYIQIFIKYGILILFYNLHYLLIDIKNFIIILGIFSIIIGSILIISQYNIIRLLTYSSISHIGFLILQYEYTYFYYLYIYTITSFLILNFLYYINSSFILRLFLTLLFFSSCGLPPFPGFYSKLYILLDLLKLGNINIILIIILSSIILSSNYIYLGLISFYLSLKFKIKYNILNYNILSFLLSFFLLFFIF